MGARLLTYEDILLTFGGVITWIDGSIRGPGGLKNTLYIDFDFLLGGRLQGQHTQRNFSTRRTNMKLEGW